MSVMTKPTKTISVSICAIQVLGVLTLMLVCAVPKVEASENVIAWGIENSQGKLVMRRVGCGDAPASCLSYLSAQWKKNPRLNWLALAYVRQTDSAESVLKKSEVYGAEKVTNVPLREVGIDDFYDFIKRIKGDKNQFLDKTITAAKRNGLEFGVTIYADQIEDLEYSKIAAFDKIDRVALYERYREDYSSYPSQVSKAKIIFPNAKIYGGVYHYDRIDYLPCRPREKKKCSENEEFANFNSLLLLQKKMLSKGDLDGLELYPGNLGEETTWAGWNQQNLCNNSRRANCIDLSVKMGRSLRQTLAIP